MNAESLPLLIVPVPAFTDNYIWVLHDTRSAWVVDPGEAGAVQSYLAAQHLTLAGILLTHHHADHIGGAAQLIAASSSALSPKMPLPVIGPATARIPMVNRTVGAGDHITLSEFNLTFEVLAVPGHVDEHIAYFAAAHAPPLLFCGDTLFAAGCGRVFEGTPERLYRSLQTLAQLPPDTAVYCAHEYTEANLRFALAAEPDNAALQARQQKVRKLRAAGQPSLPSTLAEELATNPFLRTHLPALWHAAQQQEPHAGNDPAEVFRVLRAWKNRF